ncbi:hypothetical protein LguiA_009349 [Lonicera macranthoides]
MYPSHTPFLHENYNTTSTSTSTTNITLNPIINFPSNRYDTQHEVEEALFLQNLHFLLQDEQPPQLPFSTNDINLVPKTTSSTTTTTVTTSKKMGSDEKCSKKIVEEDQDQLSKLVKKRGSRSCRKDRHSKINTAKGPRDRRVRLSVDVARRFFDLQDLLGFNKPSEIVQWLLTNSKSAITQLKNSSNSTNTETTTTETTTTETTTTTSKCGNTSSDQYCEVLSGIDESPLATLMRSTSSSSSSRKERRIKKISSTSRGFRKITSALVKRESREKARERARERTKKKNVHKRIINNVDHLELLTNSTCSRQGIIDMDMDMDMDMDVHNLSQLGFLESSTGEDQEGEVDIFGDSNLLNRGNNWTHYSTGSFIHHRQHNPAISHEVIT